MIGKVDILNAIKTFVRENGGRSPGQRIIRRLGIREHDWQKHWPNWSVALREAGQRPDPKTLAFDDEFVIRCTVSLARSLGKIPSQRDMIHWHHADPSFPSLGVIKRIGSSKQRLARLRQFCGANGGHGDILEFLGNSAANQDSDPHDPEGSTKSSTADGYVYLQKSGKYFKIGMSNAPGRREYEVGLQMPEEVKTVHIIRTDDPGGIEAYWHDRFKTKRKRGEWFALEAADVRAFKRRNDFM